MDKHIKTIYGLLIVGFLTISIQLWLQTKTINDLNTKIRQIHNFLMRGHKVRIGVFFKGRENEYTKSGIDIINRIMSDISSVGTPDSKPSLKGSAMLVVFSPITNKKK